MERDTESARHRHTVWAVHGGSGRVRRDGLSRAIRSPPRSAHSGALYAYGCARVSALCACCGRVRTALATHTYCARGPRKRPPAAPRRERAGDGVGRRDQYRVWTVVGRAAPRRAGSRGYWDKYRPQRPPARSGTPRASVRDLPEKSGIYHFLINLSSGMGEWYMKVVYNSFDS